MDDPASRMSAETDARTRGTRDLAQDITARVAIFLREAEARAAGTIR